MTGKSFRNGLHGEIAHVDTATIFEGFDWKDSGKRPGNCPHSVWELLHHMNYWQNYILEFLEGKKAEIPDELEESWPIALMPENQEAWESIVQSFLQGLKKGEEEAGKSLSQSGFGKSDSTRADLLMVLANHNSYHAGQVVTVRKLMGAWPPNCRVSL